MTWYSDGLRFRCSGCGRCCRGPTPGRVWVTIREIKRLAAFLKLDIETFARRYLLRSGSRLSLLENVSNDCIFWRDDVGCLVYEARPDQCRLYPFWAEIVETKEAWDAESAKCPGMDTGPRYSAAAIARFLEGEGATGSDPDTESSGAQSADTDDAGSQRSPEPSSSESSTTPEASAFDV